MSTQPAVHRVAAEGAAAARAYSFNPRPLADEWNRWIAGQWQCVGRSNTGAGRGVTRFEPALNGQFLVGHGEVAITAMSAQQIAYLKRNLHASDEEIARFRNEPYRSLEIYTIDEKKGEVVAFSFDSLRCIATGRGRREGMREAIRWKWHNGHRSMRITERVDADRMTVTQRTPMPDGSVMEEKSEAIRQKLSAGPLQGPPNYANPRD